MDQKTRHFRAGALTLCAILVALAMAGPVRANVQPGVRTGFLQQTGTTAVVTVVRATVYSGPSFGFFSIGGLKQNETVPVLGVSADRQFWLVNTQFGQGWLFTREVRITNEASVPGVEVGQIATITAGQVTIRASAGIGAPRVGLASKGNQFFVVGRLPDGSWLQIKYRRGIGWIAASTTDLAGAVIPPTAPAPAATAPAEGVTPPTKEAPVTAAPRAIVNTGVLNVRSGPGVQFTSLGTLSGGTIVPIIGRTKDGTWVLVDTEFGAGWVNITLVVTRDYFGNAPIKDDRETRVAAIPTAIVTAGSLNVRSGPNVAFDVIGSVKTKEVLTLLGQSPDRAWWLVDSPIGKGWVAKSGVSVITGSGSRIPVIN